MSPHPLASFELQRFYQNKSDFNSLYLRKYLPKMKQLGNVINLDQYKSVEALWIALYINGTN